MKTSAFGGFLAGATLMYFADPNRGRRRRAITRDKAVAGWRNLGCELDKAGRDLKNRARGAVSAAGSLFRRSVVDVDDAVLVERVRAAIGRAASHPHAIKARAERDGCIVLEGPVLLNEVDCLFKTVKSVPGVKGVRSRLEIYTAPGGVSSLQGGVPRRPMSEFAQERWTPALRLASGATGGAAVYAGIRNGGAAGWAGAIGGIALLARAMANRPFQEVFGIGGPAEGGIHFDKSIHIDAPVEEVYKYWSNFENFPKFMTHLKEVRPLTGSRSRWVAEGPGGISIPWEAEITEQRENELLAWRSVPGSLVRTAGMVRFDRDTDGRTRVQIRMSYCPPAGVFGHAIAWLFGADPKSEMDDDLARLKSLMETGKTRAHGTPVTRDQVAVTNPTQQPGVVL